MTMQPDRATREAARLHNYCTRCKALPGAACVRTRIEPIGTEMSTIHSERVRTDPLMTAMIVAAQHDGD